jgi:putative restriction endonuclease
MKFWVGVTDNNWFHFLKQQMPDEVNFWQPNATTSFRAIEVGAPFLFKLHSPHDYITGGGFFVSHSVLPISIAWEAFGQKNGTENYEGFRAAIGRFRRGDTPLNPDPMIGCIILASPFFFEKQDWISIPPDWARNIVRGKTYDTEAFIGRRLWDEVQERVSFQTLNSKPVVAYPEPQYGAEYLAKARLGQGAFRVLVTDAYQRKCALTGERTLPVLEAAHIKPFAQSGPHSISNGLLLRSDLHKLFDLGYLTITEDYKVEISRKIKEEFENGRDYYALHGNSLKVIPGKREYLPSTEFIQWHNSHIYVP